MAKSELTCLLCGGEGYTKELPKETDNWAIAFCDECHGTGKVRPEEYPADCPVCGGTGHLTEIAEECPYCLGNCKVPLHMAKR